MSKIASLRKFAQMEEKGIYYSEGMGVRIVNGETIIEPTYYNFPFLNEGTSLFSNIGLVTGMDNIKLDRDDYTVTIDSSNYIHCFNQLVSFNNKGKIHQVTGTTQIYPDIAVTKNENMLFSTDNYLGIGYRGIVKTGSSTTKIVDTAGRNFDTLGIGTTTGINKVINLTTKIEYTITSISTTNSTNDTLNFSASGSSPNNNGDYFVVFSDKGAKNGGNLWDFFKTTAYPHFTGQESVSNFCRQITRFDTDFLVGNGNFIAALNVDETTWNDNYKQLPDSCQFRCMDENFSKILIGVEVKGSGALLLWDGFSDGFNSRIDFTGVPTCIKKHSNGWLVFVGSTLYFTDGFNIKQVSAFPDKDTIGSTVGVNFNGMEVVDGLLMAGIKSVDLTRSRSGVAIYDFSKGWTYSLYSNGSGNPFYNVTPGCVFNSSSGNVFCSALAGSGPYTKLINLVLNTGANDGSAMFVIKLPETINITKVVLDVCSSFKTSTSGNSGTANITVKVGDLRKQLWNNFTIGTTPSTTRIYNSSDYAKYPSVSVGDEIRIASGAAAGERSFITNIVDQGLTSEYWDISPALSTAPTAGEKISVLSLKNSSSGTKTITSTDVDNSLEFDISGVNSSMIILETTIKSSDVRSIGINKIDIYG